jgi:hypothetical protein
MIYPQIPPVDEDICVAAKTIWEELEDIANGE